MTRDQDDDCEDSMPIDLTTLGAFVDNELPAAQSAQVRAHLEHDGEARARAQSWQALTGALRTLCEAHEHEHSPTSPVIVVRKRSSMPHRMALAACWAVVGAGLGVALGTFAPRWLPGSAEPAAFARRADIAYAVYAPEERHPVEVAASEESHLRAWLSKRLERPVSIPSLSEYGYTLVGGRLLPGETGPAAQIMYENADGARLTLYVTNTPPNEAAVQLLRDGNRRTFYWVIDRTGYALSGSIAEPKLRAIAVDMCSELGGRPDAWK
ncbi:anti-sigma factor family protein [Trinickia fusca]|uniref:Anti-sigma factor n=1 Tax=Trinickia fusca TaxID=2419777 RepID=A0A494X1H3_9BURK|nr:anti-sigma factor [Trinickia fusca]RKP44192.1 anti-sigma factor [Trinickia fusca]